MFVASEPAARVSVWFPLDGETSQPIGKWRPRAPLKQQTERARVALRFIFGEERSVMVKRRLTP
jgi:hypothetical protein